MNFKKYYGNVIKYDLINKFYYPNLKNVPKLKLVILSFESKNVEIRKLSKFLLALNFISKKRGILVFSKKSNILLKIRKNNAIGCNVVLKKKFMYRFFSKLVINTFFSLFLTKKFKVIKFHCLNAITFNYEKIFDFKKLEKNYNIFNNLVNFNIIIITNAKTKKEFMFLLNSFKFQK